MRDIQPAVMIAVMVADNCLIRKDAAFVSDVLINGADSVRAKMGNTQFGQRMRRTINRIYAKNRQIDEFLGHDDDFKEYMIESYKRKF